MNTVFALLSGAFVVFIICGSCMTFCGSFFDLLCDAFLCPRYGILYDILITRYPSYRKIRERIAEEEDKRIEARISKEVKKQAVKQMMSSNNNNSS